MLQFRLGEKVMQWPTIINNFNFIFTGNATRLKEDHENLAASVAQINEFIGQMVMMLHKRGSLTEEELAQLIQYYTRIASPNLNLALSVARKKENPLTPQEAKRLEYYVNKANNGYLFLPEEIHDYSQLVEKARKEIGREINPWPLVALGAFLLGLIIGSQTKTKKHLQDS